MAAGTNFVVAGRDQGLGLLGIYYATDQSLTSKRGVSLGPADEAFHRVREMAIFTTRGRRPGAAKVTVSRGSAGDQPVRSPASRDYAPSVGTMPKRRGGSPRARPAYGGGRPSLGEGRPVRDESRSGVEGRGTNRSDKGLNLSGSWQQGHSATYNTPSRI